MVATESSTGAAAVDIRRSLPSEARLVARWSLLHVRLEGASLFEHLVLIRSDLPISILWTDGVQLIDDAELRAALVIAWRASADTDLLATRVRNATTSRALEQ